MFLASDSPFLKYLLFPNFEIHLNTIVSTYIVMFIIFIFGILYRNSVYNTIKKLQFYPLNTEILVPKPLSIQNIFELIIEGINNINESILGKKIANRYMPLLVSFFIFILFSNLLGYIPPIWQVSGYSMITPPTSDLSTTLALTIISVIAYNILAIKETGLKNWLEHFIFPIPTILKNKTTFTIMLAIILLPLFLLLNVFDIFARTLSLSVRLFANIFSEHTMVEKLVHMVVSNETNIFLKIFLFFLNLFVMLIGILAVFIQAIIFEILSAVYLGLYLHGHSDEH
ncbi:MAG: F0F1 ATP synthase subunit A [bacterium]|nr:F0F1 ATP synthase subunit A [bacterium]